MLAQPDRVAVRANGSGAGGDKIAIDDSILIAERVALAGAGPVIVRVGNCDSNGNIRYRFRFPNAPVRNYGLDRSRKYVALAAGNGECIDGLLDSYRGCTGAIGIGLVDGLDKRNSS